MRNERDGPRLLGGTMKFAPFNSCRNCAHLESDGEDGYSYVTCTATWNGNLKSFPFKKAMKCFETDFHHRPQYQQPWALYKTHHLFIRYVLFEKHWGWSWQDHVKSHCKRCCFEMFTKSGSCGSCSKWGRVEILRGICWDCHLEDKVRVQEA